MSYLVLARKWRPLTFADLVGQAHIARTLSKAIETKRVAHAFLFTGTRGVGKTTSARILAMALNCEKGPTAAPCGLCGSCRDIKAGVGLDVMEIDGASNRGIDEIRALRETIAYTPAGGKHRIVIIDEVHMLTKEAFNALLKSLEEPPPNFIFIFATTEPHKVPETILSRVQRYDFKRIAPPDVFARLKTICATENIAAEEEALWQIARKANGSMRDALTLLDQIIPFCTGKITADEVRGVLGLVNTGTFLKLFDAIQAKDEAAVVGIVAEIFAEGYDLAEFAQGLEEHGRHLLLSRIKGIDPAAVNLPVEEAGRLREQAEKFHETDLLRLLEILSQLAYRLGKSASPRFELEAALIKLVNMDQAIDLAEFMRSAGNEPVKKKSEPVTQAAPKTREPAPVPAPVAEPRPVEFDFRNLKEQWRGHLSALMNDNLQLGAHLSYSFILRADEGGITIGIPKSLQFQYSEIVKPDNMRALADFFRNRCGYSGKVEVEAVEEDKSKVHLGADREHALKKAAPAPQKEQININEAVRREPILGALLDVFNGEIR